MVLAFLTGKYGGDYLAIQKAHSLGLIDAEIAHVITVPGSNLAADANLFNQKKVTVFDFTIETRKSSFSKALSLLHSIPFDYIILAGFKFLLPSSFVNSYAGKILNSHHSILPAHPGLFPKEKLVESDDKFLGATIHRVDEGVDTGAILFQAVFPNYGIGKMNQILSLFRFAQDAMVVQCVRDLGSGEHECRKETIANGIMFFPGIEDDILEAYLND
jgi:phosphoribosylglycinamide formyltransferase-1